MPVMAGTLDTPVTPDMPAMAGTSVMPDALVMPGSSNTPATAGKAGTPGMAGVPSIPVRRIWSLRAKKGSIESVGLTVADVTCTVDTLGCPADKGTTSW